MILASNPACSFIAAPTSPYYSIKLIMTSATPAEIHVYSQVIIPLAETFYNMFTLGQSDSA